MTLVEVMVAVAVVAVVAISAGALTINGLNTATFQENRQVAVTIASGVMEGINAHSAAINGSSGVSDLLTGRSQTDSQAAFSGNSSFTAVAKTYPTWDKSPVVTPPQTIPINNALPITQGGTNFTTQTLIGLCYEPTTAAAAALLTTGWDCVKLAGYAAAPATTPANFAPVLRVIVIVQWTSGLRCATAGSCSYVTTTLFDYHPDLEWISHG